MRIRVSPRRRDPTDLVEAFGFFFFFSFKTLSVEREINCKCLVFMFS